MGGSCKRRNLNRDGMTMNGYNFTERVRNVLATAREQAIRRGHEYVGPEHICIALATEGEGVACAVLQILDIAPPDLIARIDSVITKGKHDPRALGPDLPYTSRAKKILELSMASARDLDHSYVGTEHLLLGIIQEEKSVAAQMLTSMGATYDRVRAETLRLLGTNAPEVEGRMIHPPVPMSSNVHTDIASVIIEIRRADGTAEKHESQSVWRAMAFLKSQIRSQP
jgi:ATP-dependent Clp protease ATP-binding subunit ClpC